MSNKIIINAFADESCEQMAGQIDALKRNGLNGLEIRGVDGQNITKISKEKTQEVKNMLTENGLNVWSIGSPLGKIKINEDFTKHAEEFKRTLEIANDLDAKYIRMFSFYMPSECQDFSIYRDEVMDRLSKFVEMAKGSGVKLCHENEKGIYGDIATRCLEIHKNFPEIGCVFDPANFVQCNQDTLEAWKLLEKYVTYMHIKDSLPDGSIVPAGKGVGNLPEILKMYFANGGTAVTVEPHLSLFKGLADLEREGETSLIGQYKYETKEAAFDAAIAALKEIL